MIPSESGSMPLAHAGTGGGGVRLKTTRKNFAVTGGNEIVCSGAPPSGSFATSRKFCPSSLASSDFSGSDDAGDHRSNRSRTSFA